jgi:PAS domain S-box-containing protein
MELPLMRDPASLATLDVLTKVVPPALYTDANLVSLASCRAVNLSLESGNSDGSCVAYVWLGTIAGPHFDNYKAGFRFGRLGYELVEQRGLKRFQARTYMCFGCHVMPWAKHIQAGRDLLGRAFDAANKIGDLTVAAYCCDALNTNLLASGDALPEVQREAENGFEFAQKAQFGIVIDIIIAQLGLIRTLRGLTPKFGSFDDGRFEEVRFESHLASDPVLALAECWYWIRKVQARFLAGDYASAVDASLRAQQLLWTSPSLFETAEYHFYGALSHAASWDYAFPAQKQQHFEALATHHRQLEIWAANCPENFENRAALVGAEIARIGGRELEAERLYEKAIKSARANTFVHNEAVANELAARFYAARDFERIAHLYLQEARYCYLRWGADGKVRQLDQLYPHLREGEPVPGPMSTIGAPLENLDLATVIKVSQAVSGEIVLEKLIGTLMRTAIEHSGAERGLLVLPRGDALRIEAEATTSGDTVLVHLCNQAVTAAMLPQSVFHFVLHTQESVILDNATVQSPFSTDPYVREQHARSILCLPLLNQGKLLGMLYLENKLSSHVFAPARITVLKLLASQAAMSLEKTHLYHDLAEREAKIRRLVDANIISIFIWDFDGRILEANDAFLNMLGYEREDLLAGRLRWTELTPPDWRDRDAVVVREHKMTGLVRPFEKEYFRKDGSRVPVLIGVATFEEGGSQGVAFVLDLSERKRAEEALQRSQAYLADAQRLTHTGSWAWDTRTDKFIHFSEETFRIFELDPQEGLPGIEKLMQRVHPEDRERVEGASRKAALEKTAQVLDYRLLLPDGRVKYIQSIRHPVLNAIGETIEVIGTKIDITERKEAEEALHEAQAALMHAARVATMGELTASIAHEVNQPLAAVVNNANACISLLPEGNPDLEDVREALAEIINDAERASNVITRVRQLARKAPVERTPLDLREVIADVLVLARHESATRRVTIHCEIPEDLPLVLGDRVQLQQVLLNLVVNGMDAMNTVEESKRVLFIRSHRETREGRLESLVSVQDAGTGFKPEQMKRLFEAFYTTKPQGMGMGLAISRSIIEAHGGRLWAEPNQGPGATFLLSLPTAGNTAS